MHTISVEELENLDPSNITILDIRSEEDFRRGSFPGAINIPMKKNLDEDSAEEGFFEPGSIETLEKDLPANKPVYILCHTGEQSKEAVKILNEDGYNASNIDGGYRSWLRLSLERMVSEASVTERTKEIERSLIKKFRKSIWRPFTKAIRDYQLIQDGDRIAVGVSGGKDSLTLLYALAGLRKFYPHPFEIYAISVDLGYPGFDLSPVKELCERLAVPYTIVPTKIGEIITAAGQESHPCSLCAKIRRGALNQAAKELGCNKVAYAHHSDDIVETMMLSLMYEGRFYSFPPVTYLDGIDLTVIRPLMFVWEAEIIGFKNKYELPVVKNLCPADGHTKRQEVKELIRELNRKNPGVKERMLTAVLNGNIFDWPERFIGRSEQ